MTTPFGLNTSTLHPNTICVWCVLIYMHSRKSKQFFIRAGNGILPYSCDGVKRKVQRTRFY